MREKKIEKTNKLIYLLSGWKYTYSSDAFLRLRSKRSGYDIGFARLLPADNIDQLFLKTMRAGQALEMVLDESSNIEFEAISFATSDKNHIISTLDKAPYRIINIIENDNKWIVNAIWFSEAGTPPGCGSKFYRELMGRVIAAVRCSRFRLDFVDFKNEKKETIRNIANFNMLTISRKNRAYIIEDIETITSNNRQELMNILKKKLTRETEATEAQPAKI
jgi:hypothetical protein